MYWLHDFYFSKSVLSQAGHDVLTANQAGLSGQPDSIVFDYACSSKRLIITRNYDDFLALHNANPVQTGILVVYQTDLVSVISLGCLLLQNQLVVVLF